MIYLFYIMIVVTLLYIVLYGLLLFGFISQKQKVKGNSSEKKISVIIPARNEAKSIINCLQSLLYQNYSSTDYEVIIVNDHSDDNTYELVQEFIKSNKCENFKLINLEEGESKKQALKLGIYEALYDNIATTDADCILPTNWLSNISTALMPNTTMLLGPVTQEYKSGFLSNFQILDMLALQGVGFGSLGLGVPIMNNAANLSFTKEAFESVNGYDNYDTPSGDDVFLLDKFRNKKLPIKGVLSEEFVVTTKLESTFKDLLNQRLRWASKSKFYKNWFTLVIGLTTVLQNITILFIYLGLILVENYRIELLFLLSCKWLIDFILLFLVASFFRRRRALIYFIPIQLIYPVYLVFVWVASLTISYNWKGRTING